MKILYVDNANTGHHEAYLKGLTNSTDYCSIALLSKSIKDLNAEQVVYTKFVVGTKSIKEYIKWIKVIEKIVEKEEVSVVHFLDGDSIMRYFGMGLSKLKNISKVFFTFHHFFPGLARRISYKSIFGQIDYGVVHTESVKSKIEKLGIRNIIKIDYPSFVNQIEGYSEKLNKDESKVKVILALGGTRYDKGIDILIKALYPIEVPYKLIIAGITRDFTEEKINSLIEPISKNVQLDLRYLPEQVMLAYLKQADIVALPYRKIFDGASGPLCDGVYLRKVIIGPSYGSLNEIIIKNHVGFTFESEDIKDLTVKLKNILNSNFVYDDTAIAYSHSLAPEVFRSKYFQLYTY